MDLLWISLAVYALLGTLCVALYFYINHPLDTKNVTERLNDFLLVPLFIFLLWPYLLFSALKERLQESD